MKRFQFLWIIVIVFTATSLLLGGCGGAEPTATPEQVSEGGPTSTPKELLGATAMPTPIPVTPTPTPVPLPPTPTTRPAQEQEEAAEFKPLTEMVEIPGGPFVMGRDGGEADEGPAHEVELPTFYIEIFEVTNVQFVAFVQDTGYVTDGEQKGKPGWRAYVNGKDNHPVVKVSWNDAEAYCDWAGRRLPTEAEWEKAARGPDGFLYPWGNNWDPQKANVKEAGFRGTTSVGTFADGVSGYGVFDMAGNVWEWTADWYQAYPGNTAADEFYGEKFKVTKGGGWFDEESQVLSVNRSAASVDTANDDIGFRCVSDSK